MYSSNILAVGIPCIVALVVALRLTRKRAHTLPLPPGPKGLPILGNALQLDTDRPWISYLAWGKKYGKIMHIRLPGTDIIVINSEAVAREILDKRSGNYAGRPVIPTNELYGLSFNTVLLPYGDLLRQHRQIFHDVLKAEASATYHDMYSHHAKRLVLNLVNATGDLQIQTNRYSGSLIMAVIYGHSAEAREDSVRDSAFELGQIGKSAVTPEKAALLTAFPILKKMPLGIFRVFGGVFALVGRSRQLAQQLLREPYDKVKAQIADGTAKQSLVADFLSRPHDDASENAMRAVALTASTAGIDTIASILHNFLMCMLLHPHVQERARAEIDKVVAHDAMPSINDRASLPYIDAIIHEVLRCYPFTPIGIPHTTLNDDVYDGYLIPKGAIVTVNQWMLSRTEDDSGLPCFDPDRHLTVDGKLKTEPFTNHIGFGNGRRVCPGRYFAEFSVWTATVSVLAVLRISHAKDSNGNKIEVKQQFTCGIGVRPQPFEYTFEIVNPAREKQLRAVLNLE